MKRYIKDSKVKYANQIIVDKNGFNIINPSEEDILADGWVEHIDKVPTEDELLESAKCTKLCELEQYDISNNINKFTYNNQPFWFNKEQRLAIKDRYQREQMKGIEKTKLFINGEKIDITPTEGIQLINALSEYSDKCFDQTEKHKMAIKKLMKKEEVESYDYTIGYPNVLSL